MAVDSDAGLTPQEKEIKGLKKRLAVDSDAGLTPQEKEIKGLKKRLLLTEQILDLVLAEKYKKRKKTTKGSPNTVTMIIHTTCQVLCEFLLTLILFYFVILP